MKVRVDVKLKNGVLDPQGRAIAHALHGLGFDEVQDVHIGKAIIIETNESDAEIAKTRAKEMALKLLVNQVIETYSVEIIE
ncbi:MAG: phosphoribosylformylglycinamidine synthase subunit PurS [Caulobacterales bacterium]|nr:phosphoribosylformylglycinamidine synthase subunit PurS [Caulobacterales bacterium]